MARYTALPATRTSGASEELANKIQKNVDLARAGLPKLPLDDQRLDQKYGNAHAQLGKPLTETIALYLTNLVRKGTPADSCHYRDARCILATITKGCHWNTLVDIRPDAFTRYLARMAENGRAPRTQNRHLEILRAFANWCAAQGWLRESPLARMKMVQQTGKGRRRNRRAYTLEEWKRIMAVAPEPRKTIYLVASFSGLRRSELERLQKCDCTPLGTNPRWHTRPEVSKNGLPIALPMLPECAAALRPIWESLPSPTSRLFLDRRRRSAVPKPRTLYRDLATADVRRQDDQARWVDFHSFRNFFCRQLAEKLPIQKVKTLLRHSTITLTADLYGKLGMDDVAEDVWTLPPMSTSTAQESPDHQPARRRNSLPPAGFEPATLGLGNRCSIP